MVRVDTTERIDLSGNWNDTDANLVAGNIRRSAGMRQFAADDLAAAGAKENLWQQDSEGNTLWTLNNPGIDPDVVTNAAQWFINADGILQFYRVGSEVTPIDGSSGIVYEYAIIADLDRLEPPVPGTSLDLEAIGVPEELRGIEE